MKVFDANPKIVELLAEKGALLNKPGEHGRHSYPHCWRCHNPIIFRATQQWFISHGRRSAAAAQEGARARSTTA